MQTDQMTPFLTSFLVLIGGYILGSIPFGLLIARAAGQGDIRSIGSGNIGATNVLRTGRKDLAMITLLLDAAKAGVAVLVIKHFFGLEYGLMAGGAALIGHCFPIWLKFRGGKGVATYFGFLFAGAWQVGIIAGIVWLISAFISRMSSLSALLAALIAPIAASLLTSKSMTIAAAVLSFVIFVRHKDNIGRILAGTESKIGKSK